MKTVEFDKISVDVECRLKRRQRIFRRGGEAISL
jgi:hypothetical protein